MLDCSAKWWLQAKKKKAICDCRFEFGHIVCSKSEHTPERKEPIRTKYIDVLTWHNFHLIFSLHYTKFTYTFLKNRICLFWNPQKCEKSMWSKTNKQKLYDVTEGTDTSPWLVEWQHHQPGVPCLRAPHDHLLFVPSETLHH